MEQVRTISQMVSVAYVRQKEALGLGHAILMAKDLVGHEPFAVLLGDDVIDAAIPCLQQMLLAYEKYGSCILAVQTVEGSEISRHGVIRAYPVPKSGDERIRRVSDVVEKPSYENAPSNMAIIGRYILPPQIFTILERITPDQGGEIQLTNGIRAFLKEQPVYAYLFEGKRYDAGDKLGFLMATVEFALKRADLGGPFREYLKRLDSQQNTLALVQSRSA